MEAMKYNVYVIESKEGYRYIGQTGDLERRMAGHNGGLSHSTKHGTSWKVVHLEQYETRKEPMEREKYLKTSGGGDISIVLSAGSDRGVESVRC
jgi:putative endonuclease